MRKTLASILIPAFAVLLLYATSLSAHTSSSRQVGDIIKDDPTCQLAPEPKLPVKDKTVTAVKSLTCAVQKFDDRFSLTPDEPVIVVDPRYQELYVVKDREITHVYPISTSKKGLGVVHRSQKTPWGSHYISNKIGDGKPLMTRFKGRKVCKGRGCSTITTRILWLRGLEEGINLDLSINKDSFWKKDHVDSHWRFIYIHGTSRRKVGKPASIGCINMKNKDVVELFDMVREGTLVEILNNPYPH